jgi:hypothetical protein
MLDLITNSGLVSPSQNLMCSLEGLLVTTEPEHPPCSLCLEHHSPEQFLEGDDLAWVEFFGHGSPPLRALQMIFLADAQMGSATVSREPDDIRWRQATRRYSEGVLKMKNGK